MKIPKIYIETSVLNFVFADDSPDKREVTIKLFEEIKEGRYLPFTSDYVKREIDNTSDLHKNDELNRLMIEYKIEILPMREEISRLANEYVKEGIIPTKHQMDAFHIAAATVYDLDMILSWNFQHIVKKKTIMMTESINLRNGYKKVEICSPSEVVENV